MKHILTPLDLLNNKKSKQDVNKNVSRNKIQLTARNLIKEMNAYENNSVLLGRLIAQIEVRNSLVAILGNDGYMKQIQGKSNLLKKEIEVSYHPKIIRASISDKQTINHVMKQLISHAILFHNKALKEENEVDIDFTKGLLKEYYTICNSLSDVLIKSNYTKLKSLL